MSKIDTFGDAQLCALARRKKRRSVSTPSIPRLISGGVGWVDLKKISKIYFVGIKGVAMCALAVLAKESGFQVAGSDTEETFPTDEVLKRVNINAKKKFSAKNITIYEPQLVIYTGAHDGKSNIEVQKAISLNIPVMSHAQALGLFMSGNKQISVAGCHGKTTTTAVIASVFVANKKDPSYAIGSGLVRGLGLPGHKGSSNWFISEADEYVTDKEHDQTPRFLWQNPDIALITNIDFDHADVYKDINHIKKAYMKFSDKCAQKGGIIIINGDDKHSYEIADKHDCIKVGFKKENEFIIKNYTVKDKYSAFSLFQAGACLVKLKTQIAGRHNALNTALASVCLKKSGLSWTEIRKGLALFRGTKRRFEVIGKLNSNIFIDDYAHHPHEISAVINAVKERYGKKRIIAVFQPHTYTRTKALIDDFVLCLSALPEVIIAKTYASAREKRSSNNKLLYLRLKNKRNQISFADSKYELFKILKRIIKRDDIVLFMGAGNINQWGEYILKEMKKI